VERWSSGTSKKYQLKQFFYAFIFWLAFNILTGLLTEDYSLNDNHFILFIAILIATIKSSYQVFFKNGFIITRKFGMVTQNINLYKASKVQETSSDLVIYYFDSSRFKIKLSILEKSKQEIAKNQIIPLEGEAPKTSEIVKSKIIKTSKKPNYLHNIIGGLVLILFGIISLFTDTIYLPSAHGFIYASKEPEAFVFFQLLCLLGGIGSTLYASYQLLRKSSA
jgi:hypothetical protein